MIEINGWVIIREAFNEQEEDEKLLEEVIKKIKTKLMLMDNINEFYNLKALNGWYHLSIMANHNHRSEHVIDFFKWLGIVAKGSYGLLYVLDDEDVERGNENKFKVWRLKKGIVNELDDPFLSPVNPEVEE